jgi:intracellular septation protein
MTATPETPAAPPSGAKAGLKLLLELGPLVLYFGLNAWLKRHAPEGAGEVDHLVGATKGFLIAILIAFPLAWKLEGKLPVMSLVTAVLVGVFGGLTIWLGDTTFIKLKPTVASLFIALVLLGGLARGRYFLKTLLGANMPMDQEGWRILTWRWSAYFLFVAGLNELIWRTQSGDTWLTFKVWGILPMTFVFTLFQMGLMKRHELPEAEAGDRPG